MSQMIEELDLIQCLEKWVRFKKDRNFYTKETEEWFLTVNDREAILDKVVDYYEENKLNILDEDDENE